MTGEERTVSIDAADGSWMSRVRLFVRETHDCGATVVEITQVDTVPEHREKGLALDVLRLTRTMYPDAVLMDNLLDNRPEGQSLSARARREFEIAAWDEMRCVCGANEAERVV